MLPCYYPLNYLFVIKLLSNQIKYMHNLLKNKFVISLGWGLHSAVILAMILYMNYIQIAISIGLIISVAVIIPTILLLKLQKLEIIPPDNDSSMRFVSKYGYMFGLFSHFIIFYLYLSFYQTLVSLFVGIILSTSFFLLRKIFMDNK